MRLICMTGIDGAGKTTLVRRTVSALQRKGESAVYVYGRTYPVLSRFLMAAGRITLLRKQDIWQDYGQYATSKKRVMRNPFLSWVYTASVLVDYYSQIWLKLLPHFFSRRFVILDRYVYDTVINDLSVHLSYSEERTAKAIDQGLRLLPTPMLSILIDLPEEVAFSRKDDMPHVDFLKERRELYVQLLSRPEFMKINGEDDPDELLRETLQLINEKVLPDSKEVVA